MSPPSLCSLLSLKLVLESPLLVVTVSLMAMNFEHLKEQLLSDDLQVAVAVSIDARAKTKRGDSVCSSWTPLSNFCPLAHTMTLCTLRCFCRLRATGSGPGPVLPVQAAYDISIGPLVVPISAAAPQAPCAGATNAFCKEGVYLWGREGGGAAQSHRRWTPPGCPSLPR